jgi:UDP-N-acetylmuramyl pentapeptide phosphotransferase/UDP-N-acetylglucosamine-1-phosphate transferase
MLNYLLITLILIALIQAYFWLSVKYNIFDVPNHRSSHSQLTIRGAGVIFPLAVILGFLFFGDVPVVLIAGVLIISIISFVDDVVPLSALLRLAVHLLAVSLMLYALHVYQLWPLWYIIPVYILSIGLINAFNFMDGINGITGIYSAITLATMLFINKYIIVFTNNTSIICVLIACFIFLFYNFRKKAKCFAGDVGSISIAFWLIVLTISIIIKTNNFKYLFLFAVYGVDVVFTIIKRIKLKQNLLQAHRLHAYQLLVNNGKYSHLFVAVLYGLMQLIINVLLITTQLSFGGYTVIIGSVLGGIYLCIQRSYNLKMA